MRTLTQASKDHSLTLTLVNTHSKPNWLFRATAGAALTLLICLLGLFAWKVPAPPPKWISYATRIGGYENIRLVNGTSVQLNTDSAIKVQVTPQTCTIQVVRGEALIKAAHDTRCAITIPTADPELRVDWPGNTATIFGVRLRSPRSAEIAVIQDNVLVEPLQLTIAAGELATITPQGTHLVKVGLNELNRKLSWTAGVLSFNGQTLQEVAEEFNGHNRKHLVVLDPWTANRSIGGTFRATDPDSFVLALRKSFPIHADERVLPDSKDRVIQLSRAY